MATIANGPYWLSLPTDNPELIDARIERERILLDRAVDALIVAQDDLRTVRCLVSASQASGDDDAHERACTRLEYLETIHQSERMNVWAHHRKLTALCPPPSPPEPIDETYRVCTRCTRAFPQDNVSRSRINAYCGDCRRARDRAEYAARSEHYRLQGRLWQARQSAEWHRRRVERTRERRAAVRATQ